MQTGVAFFGSGIEASNLLLRANYTQLRERRVLDSRPKGRGFEPHRRHCVVSLSKNINPSLVLVQPRNTHPFITERLLMGRKESNQTNKHTVAKLTCPCNKLQTSISFTRSDTGAVMDSEPHLSCTYKTSVLFEPLAVCVQAGCSAIPFYTPTKPLLLLYFKYKTVLIPNLKIIFIF